MRRGKYRGFGVFLLRYFPLVKTYKPLHFNAEKLIELGSKNKKHLRGSTQATILPLAIILTVALWALVSIIGKLGYIDRTTPDPRWASKNPCTTPKGEGRDFSDDPPILADFGLTFA